MSKIIVKILKDRWAYFILSRQNNLMKVYLVLLFLALSVVSIFVGINELSFHNLFQLGSTEQTILLTTRLPRTISLILAGATLSLSGLLMQQLTQNKFTSPSTTGTMQSARLGLIVSMLLFPSASIINRTVFAFIFAVVGTFIFLALLYQIRAKNSIIVPIIGIMFGNVISSLGTYIALQSDIVQDVSAWLQGSFSLVHSENYQLILFSLIAMLGIILGAHYFSVVGLGRGMVTQLGVSYERILLIGIILISLGTSTVLLTVGSIPFVGIIIPNLVSLINGDYFKNNIFYVTIWGAMFLLISDIIARVIIFPYEIPVSVIIGILGSVIFIFLLLRGELT